MPAIKYTPSADCAYTQLISKIKGVPIETQINNHSRTSSPITPDASSGETQPKTGVEVKQISSGLMLAQCYMNSDSEDEDDDNENSTHQGSQNVTRVTSHTVDVPVPPEILCPPPDMQVIIDKTAAYVLKNGKDFEDVLRTRNDGRFTFLERSDPHHRYYIFKATGKVLPEVKPTPPKQPAPVSLHSVPMTSTKCDSPTRKVSVEKPPAPVSFSIKPKEEPAAPIIVKPVLPGANSDEEDDSLAKKRKATAQLYVADTDLPLPANFQQANFKLQATATPSLTASSPNASVNGNVSLNASVDQSDSFIRDAILEHQNLAEKKEAKRGKRTRSRICGYALTLFRLWDDTFGERYQLVEPYLYSPVNHSSNQHMLIAFLNVLCVYLYCRIHFVCSAEDKVRDRLAQLAREKLGILSKEKQLQLERKKRAMAFLTQIGGKHN